MGFEKMWRVQARSAGIVLLGLAAASANAQVPADIEAGLRKIGQIVDPACTARLYRPLMPKNDKTVVPDREKRLDKIGDPKTPKMGGITPKTIKLPSVDGLLDKMQKATEPAVAPTVRVRFMPPENGYKFVSFDLGVSSNGGRCPHGCSCPFCRRGDCGRCTVDALYQRLFQRAPTPQEKQLAQQFLEQTGHNWPQYAQVLMSSNEFLFIN